MSFEIKRAATVAEAITHLAEDGIVVMDGVLSQTEVAALRSTLFQEIERDRQAGTLFHDGDDSNERLLDIVHRDKSFRDLVERPLSLEIVSNWLKPRFRLSSFGANVTTPGTKAIFVHADQNYVPSPWPTYPVAMNLVWALDDFTEANGATHFLPGSHRATRGPDPAKAYPDTVPMLCDAGSLIIMDGRMWHHTGINSTSDQKRAALLTYFVNWFIIPQTDWEKVVGPDVKAELSPIMRELLGFGERASMVLEQYEGA